MPKSDKYLLPFLRTFRAAAIVTLLELLRNEIVPTANHGSEHSYYEQAARRKI